MSPLISSSRILSYKVLGKFSRYYPNLSLAGCVRLFRLTIAIIEPFLAFYWSYLTLSPLSTPAKSRISCRSNWRAEAASRSANQGRWRYMSPYTSIFAAACIRCSRERPNCGLAGTCSFAKPHHPGHYAPIFKRDKPSIHLTEHFDFKLLESRPVTLSAWTKVRDELKSEIRGACTYLI